MSLILEALRKLDREKAAPDRGFVVLGSANWPQRSRLRVLVGVAVTAMLVGAMASAWALRRRAPAPTAPLAEAPAPTTPGTAPAAVSVAKAGPAAASAAPMRTASEPARPAVGAPPEPASAAAVPLPAAPASDPLPSPAAAPPAFHLTAIGERDGRPVAVLNDRLVHEGDSFDGVSVLRIGASEVEIEVQGRRLTVGF